MLGQDALAFESALKSMGDVALGIITVAHYDYNHNSPLNHEFVKAYNEEFHRNPDIYSIGGYDGMHLIYEALKKTGGDADGDSLIAAAKGMSWQSPRGPISIDPETRDIIQTVYIRRVEKVDGELVNVEFDKVENVKDPVKERMKSTDAAIRHTLAAGGSPASNNAPSQEPRDPRRERRFGSRRFSLLVRVGHSRQQQTKGEDTMKRFLLAGVGAFVPSLLPAAGHAQDTVKIGVIMPYSGQFADPATQMDNGIKLYLKQHGDKLGGKNVEIIRKDDRRHQSAGCQTAGAGIGDPRQRRSSSPASS